MLLLFFFLFLIVHGENYWVIKQERTREKINFRIQLELPNKKFIVYSKHKPNKHAIPFVKQHSPGIINVVNKECTSQNHNFLTAQVIYGNTSCMILDAYNDTGNPYLSYQLTGTEITSIGTNLNLPSPISSNLLTMIIDTGLDLNHCFFSDVNADTHFYTYYNTLLAQATDSDHERISAYIKHQGSDFVDKNGGHGTHVAGIFGGKRCFTKQGLSTSRIVFVDISSGGPYLSLPTNLIALLQTLNVRISSSSWGSLSYGNYDQTAFQFDWFVYYQNKKHIPVIAIGNNCPAGLVSSPGYTTWNAISVGAVNNNNVIQSFSCKPINSQLQPFIYIPGVAVISAYAEENDLFHFSFTTMTGTSMSTPAGAAVVDLTINRLLQLGYDPSNALVRATILANTYSRDRIYRVMHNFFNSTTRWRFYDNQQVPIQQNYQVCFYVLANTLFTASLAWLEPPSAQLTHDLDLLVKFNEYSIWGNYGELSDVTNNKEIVLENVNKDTTVSVMISDTTASRALFALAITSSKELQEIQCNTTCSELDPPIECDFDAEGNSGYYLCTEDGKLDKTKCLFHACDVHSNSIYVNNSCVLLNTSLTEPTLVKNTYYVNLIYIKACKEHCFISTNSETSDCECSTVYSPAPAPTTNGENPGFVRKSSASSLISRRWVHELQLGIIIVFVFNMIFEQFC